MSLFATLSQGDIWAISGISFANPINDILEKDDFTLEELLREEELLQELKAHNQRLAEFLSGPEIVEKMINYVITPAEADADEFRTLKYPYMACEVFSCEVPGILQVMVSEENGRLLTALFSFLSQDGPLDHYLAGYFEKVLDMLFRRMTVPIMSYLNANGSTLLESFLKHMNNYSIMQLVQRLLLPHIPFNPTGNEDDPALTEMSRCNWSSLDFTCEQLCARMLTATDVDTPPHISDLFITVMQLSPPEALILSHMSQPATLNSFLEHAIVDGADMASTADVPTAKAAISLAALAVFEAIVARLCETAASIAELAEAHDDEMTVELHLKVNSYINRVVDALLPYMDRIAAQLKAYNMSNPCGSVAGQAKHSYPRLGHRGLQLVKLVESIVRLSNPVLDEKLRTTGIISNTMDLIFAFDMNSMLHLSVQRIVLLIVEGGSDRRALQVYLLIECRFLQRIMDQLWATRCPSDVDATETNKQTRLKGAGEGEEDDSDTLMLSASSPCIGHLVNISQAINHIMSGEAFAVTDDEDEEEASEGGNAEKKKEQHTSGDADADAEAVIETTVQNCSSGAKTDVDIDSAAVGTAMVDGAEKALMEAVTTAQSPPPGIKGIMMEAELSTGWESFTDHILRPLEGQTTADEPDYEGDNGHSAQMELAMAALGQSGMKILNWTGSGASGDDGDGDGDGEYGEENAGQSAYRSGGDHIAMDDDSDSDEEEEDGDRRKADAQQQADLQVNGSGMADFADFDQQAPHVAPLASTAVSVPSFSANDDFAGFADFDSAPENDNNSNIESESSKMKPGSVIELAGASSAEDPFGDSNVDVLAISIESDKSNGNMVSPPDVEGEGDVDGDGDELE